MAYLCVSFTIQGSSNRRISRILFLEHTSNFFSKTFSTPVFSQTATSNSPSCQHDEEPKVQTHCIAQNPSCPSDPHQYILCTIFFLCFAYFILQVLPVPYQAENTILLHTFISAIAVPFAWTTCSLFQNLLDILCDLMQMSHPLPGLTLLCDLIVRHTQLYVSTQQRSLSPSGPEETVLPILSTMLQLY